MILNYNDFITESKNYNLYRGVGYRGLQDIVSNNVLKSGSDSDWDCIRKEILDIDFGISATRNFNTALNYGYGCVVEFDMHKLSSLFKIVPFSENPDYYLYYTDKDSDTNDLKSMLRSKDKKDNEEVWRYKTDKYADDFGIAEEIIIAKQIPLSCIKRLYVDNSIIKNYKDSLEKLGIEYMVINGGNLVNHRYRDKMKTKSI